MDSLPFGSYRPHLVSEERCHLSPGETLDEFSLFVIKSTRTPRYKHFPVSLPLESRQSLGLVLPEQLAYALAQVTAASLLPPLIDLENGDDLLDYQVDLRCVLQHDVVAELVAVLDSLGPELHWGQVDATGYACVIGAGVAACIDVTAGAEKLYLRYANALAGVIQQARRPAELPRSLLFLQTTLYERFDALLQSTRDRLWYWLNS